MTTTSAGVADGRAGELLSRAACLRLLAEHSVGRVAYTWRALPALHSVHYALVGSRLVLHRLDDPRARLDGQVIAFAIDDGDAGSEGRWSVQVRGVAAALGDPLELLRPDWEPGELTRGAFDGAVQLSLRDVHGRQNA